MGRRVVASSALSLAVFTAGVASGQVSAQVLPTPDRPILTLSVNESIKSTPDAANVGVSVQSLDKSASKALSDNAPRMDRVIAALKSKGVAPKDIQTTGISVGPEYTYSQVPGVPPAFSGYRVSNSVRVTTYDIGKLGNLLDAMVGAGGTGVEGPNFYIKDTALLLKEAPIKSFSAADAQAAFYASKTGFARAKMIAITEGGGFSGQMGGFSSDAIAVTAVSAQAITPVAPGQVSTGTT